MLSYLQNFELNTHAQIIFPLLSNSSPLLYECIRFIKTNYLVSMDEQSDKSTHGTINSYYFMTAIIGDVILNIVTKDAMLALFSFAFIFFWLRLNTR